MDNIKSINFHIIDKCNYNCRFCFSNYKTTKTLSEKDVFSIIDEIVKSGIQKITFAGGEPLLHKSLTKFIKYSKEKGLTTMIVTNGSRLTEKWIIEQVGYLDWITLSIDSLNTTNQISIGRYEKKKTITKENYKNIIQIIKQNKIRFKLNTVVCSINKNEDISNFINITKPERWKIFQVLPIRGQNDKHINDLIISKEAFDTYVNRHKNQTDKEIDIVAENNNLMTTSYLMIDPEGKLYDNHKGTYTYSNPILEIGLKKAITQVKIDTEKYRERRAVYSWSE